MPATFTEPSLSDRFALLVGAVCQTAAARLARNWAGTPLLLLLHGWLQRTIARFARIAARAEAGTLQPPRARPSRQPTPERPPRRRLPEGFGWLADWVPDTRVFGSQLQYLLVDPRMAALLEAAPQLGRLLRPLCRMLAVPATAVPAAAVPAAAVPPAPSRRAASAVQSPAPPSLGALALPPVAVREKRPG